MKITNRLAIYGSGTPILLLHGMGGSAPIIPLAEMLAKQYKIICPIMPGFHSEDGVIEYTDELYVQFIEDIAESLSIAQWTVIGYSMGGRTAMNYTISNPQKVDKLILIDSVGVGYMNPLFRYKKGKELFSLLIKWALKYRYCQELMGKADFLDSQSSVYYESAAAFSNMIKDESVRGNFARILPYIGCPINGLESKAQSLHMPTLLLWAQNDKTAPLDWGIALSRLFKRSVLEIVNDYGHMAIAEQADFYVGHILSFLESAAN